MTNAVCVCPTERHHSTGTPVFGECRSTRWSGIAVEIRRVRDALDGRRVDAVLHHHRLERRAGDDRLADDASCCHAIGMPSASSADPRAVHERRAVVAAAHVVLARPDGLHRLRRGLRDLHRLARRSRRSAWRAGRSRRRGTSCGSRPVRLEAGDLAAATAGPPSGTACRSRSRTCPRMSDRAVERLHRRVREIRHGVLGLDRLRAASPAPRPRRRLSRRRHRLLRRACANCSRSCRRLSSAACGPRSHSTSSASRPASRPRSDRRPPRRRSAPARPCARPAPPARRRASNDFTLPPNTGGRATTRRQHARQLHVDAELRACR